MFQPAFSCVQHPKAGQKTQQTLYSEPFNCLCTTESVVVKMGLHFYFNLGHFIFPPSTDIDVQPWIMMVIPENLKPMDGCRCLWFLRSLARNSNSPSPPAPLIHSCLKLSSQFEFAFFTHELTNLSWLTDKAKRARLSKVWTLVSMAKRV